MQTTGCRYLQALSRALDALCASCAEKVSTKKKDNYDYEMDLLLRWRTKLRASTLVRIYPTFTI